MSRTNAQSPPGPTNKCILIGTINNDAGFLSDPTGSRRFLVVTLTQIDWAYVQRDTDQLWAEAVAAYHSGEPWRLADEEKAVQVATNQRYEIDDPIESAIVKYCEITHDDADFMTGADLLELIQAHRRGFQPRALQMAIASTAKRLGLEKAWRTVNGRQQRGYAGIRPNPPDDRLI